MFGGDFGVNSSFKEMESGFGIGSAQQLSELRKALSAGYVTGNGGLAGQQTGGGRGGPLPLPPRGNSVPCGPVSSIRWMTFAPASVLPSPRPETTSAGMTYEPEAGDTARWSVRPATGDANKP